MYGTGPPVPLKRKPEQRHVEMAKELLWGFHQH
jgi:hypothetical protein